MTFSRNDFNVHNGKCLAVQFVLEISIVEIINSMTSKRLKVLYTIYKFEGSQKERNQMLKKNRI